MPISRLAQAVFAIFLFALSPFLFAQTQQDTSSNPAEPGIVYRNPQYGFCLTLPQSWQGYSVVVDRWDGSNNSGPQGYQVVEHGPLISIRHPLWTKENPRQDIPIMVFKRAQWAAMEKDEFHIGAAPIGPDELGRSRKYVFALPARYNFAYLTGFEEVDKIVHGKTFHGSCRKQAIPGR